MPELPEVETIVRGLYKKVLGLMIQDVWSNVPKLGAGKWKSKVVGAKISDVKRKGKNILFYLSNGKLLLVHQKMTGHLLYGKWKKEKGEWISLKRGPLLDDKTNRFIHLIFYLNNGYMLALSDLRKFAKVVVFNTQDTDSIEDINKLGPDALKISFSDFKKRILSKKKDIKQVLLDQGVVAGIGNIYGDDILWSSRIHPKRKSNSLNDKELGKIFKSMRDILKIAIAKRGASISNFRDSSGNKGKYGEIRLVYKREKEPCKKCKTAIKRIKVGGRSSCFCPKCQKL